MCDVPFEEACDSADKRIREGGTVFQKFTCRGCGTRQTIDEPNAFYMYGKCEECGYVTDIVKAGCNYMLVIAIGGNHDEPTTTH